MTQTTPIYRIIFSQGSNVYEVYAHSVYQSDMYGFIEIEELVFGERSQMIVDPTAERLKTEFAGVGRSFIPMHAVIRIDEVEKEGSAKITASDGSNVAAFPLRPPANQRTPESGD